MKQHMSDSWLARLNCGLCDGLIVDAHIPKGREGWAATVVTYTSDSSKSIRDTQLSRLQLKRPQPSE